MISRGGIARIARVALAGASTLLLGGPALAQSSQPPLVIAHRGGAALMPENTFPAFDNAVRLGADWLEFDMQVTADDQLIISHDNTINPTFCSPDPRSGQTTRPIRTMVLAEVLQFDCGSRHRAIYPDQAAVPGTRMPTLDALLARYHDARQVLFGETKMPGPNEGDVDPAAFAKLVAEMVHRYGLEDRFILQSADFRTIDAMHAISPRIRTCLLYPWLAKADYLELARQHHATCMLLRLQDADANQTQRLRRAGIIIISDVVDNDADWSKYLARGVDALFTNDPAALIAYLKRR